MVKPKVVLGVFYFYPLPSPWATADPAWASICYCILFILLLHTGETLLI